jgi:hypothetical protein
MSSAMIVFCSGDILKVTGQTAAGLGYVTFWKYTVVESNLYMPMRMMGDLQRGFIVLCCLAERQDSPMSRLCGLQNSCHNGTAMAHGITMVHSTLQANDANSAPCLHMSKLLTS